MSLLSALDESDNSKHHGWNTSCRFAMDSSVNNQEGSSSTYHQYIHRNNAGTAPDAVQEEGGVQLNGIGQTYQTDFGQGRQGLPPQRIIQGKHQQPTFQSHPQQQQQMVNPTQQQTVNKQQQHQQQHQQQQQHHVIHNTQSHMVQSSHQQMTLSQQHAVNSSPRQLLTHPQQHVVHNNSQHQGMNQHHSHSPMVNHSPGPGINRAQVGNRPQVRPQPMMNRPRFQQQHLPRGQFHQKQAPHSIQPQTSPGRPGKKLVYTVVQQDGKRVEIPPEQLNTFVHTRPQLQGVQGQVQQRESATVQVPNNGGSLNQAASSAKVNEEDIDRALKLGQQKIAENKKMLAVYQQLGLTPPVVEQSPQGQNKLSGASPGGSNMNVLNTSQTQMKASEVQGTESNGATNQSKTIQHVNAGGTGNSSQPLTVQRPNTTYVQQGFGPKTIPSLQNYEGGDGNTKVHQNPVQVSSISSNQIPPSPSATGPTSKINKDNVVLEGGGHFEEGQLYVIRDKKGQVQTMQWKNGDFVPAENTKIIQHQVVDSSQRGRGSRGRGRGRGRGQGNVHSGSPAIGRGGQSGARFPGLHQFVRPNLEGRAPNSSTQQNLQQHQPQPGSQLHQAGSKTLIIQTHFPRTTSITVSPNVSGSVAMSSPQAPILNMVTLKNLMPPAQGSQKITHSSGTNLARDNMSQDEKEDPETELNQSTNTSPLVTSQGEQTDIQDPPRIPNDPNAVAVCQFCGYVSEDKVKCESCRRRFTSTTKYQIKGSGAPLNTDKSQQKKRKGDTSAISDGVNKKTFYSKQGDERNNFYTSIIQSANGPPTLAVTCPRNPRIIMRRAGRPRGRGRGRGVFIPETITLSSDEEEGDPSKKSAGDQNNSSHSKSSSQQDLSASQDCPESPLIPNIPISSSKLENKNRRDKMEDEAGKSRSNREKSVSPAHVLLDAKTVTVGTFRGIPLEPIVLCKSGLRFFVEGKQGSHRFSIFPDEIQQCLAHFSNKNTNSYLFFLVSEGCGTRTRKDLGIREHKDKNTAPPDPYFDPFGAVLTHQMITVVLENVEKTVVVEFQKYMDKFKEDGKQGDEAFFMELSEQEADEVRKQSLKKMIVVVPPPQPGVPSQPMIQDHQYSQHGEEGRSRSPSPPRIGFQGTVVRLLTYPPPPEKRGISITNEDLYCLQEGEFLNDVIIDFYLKYLHMEKMSQKDKDRTHIFSSFFYKRLTQRIRGAAIDDDPSLGLAEKRHARVKTWTRHVDLFKKDFIVVPINEHAHWFLAIICYPWLMEPVEHRYIPNRPSSPTLESQNIPTPPQPTDENTEDPENEDPEQNPVKEEPLEAPDKPTPSVDPTDTSTTETPTETPKETPTGTPTETPTETSTETPTETSTETPTETTPTETPTQPQSQDEGENPTKGEADEAQPESQEEKMEVEQNEMTSENPLETESEEMDTSEKPEESSDNKDGGEELNQEKAEGATDTPTLSKQAINRGLQVIRPIRGHPLEDGDSNVEDVMTGIKQPCILIFDSLLGPSRSRIVTVLKEYLQVEWQAKKAAEHERPLNKAIFRGCVPKVPQQNNYSDCGVFMLQYVESFFEDPIQDFTTPMKGLHDWFTSQKIEGKREELKDLVISLKEKYESKSEGADKT